MVFVQRPDLFPRPHSKGTKRSREDRDKTKDRFKRFVQCIGQFVFKMLSCEKRKKKIKKKKENKAGEKDNGNETLAWGVIRKDDRNATPTSTTRPRVLWFQVLTQDHWRTTLVGRSYIWFVNRYFSATSSNIWVVSHFCHKHANGTHLWPCTNI